MRASPEKRGVPESAGQLFCMIIPHAMQKSLGVAKTYIIRYTLMKQMKWRIIGHLPGEGVSRIVHPNDT
jgi:hypothetical protein